jgi:hypothetical protein
VIPQPVGIRRFGSESESFEIKSRQNLRVERPFAREGKYLESDQDYATPTNASVSTFVIMVYNRGKLAFLGNILLMSKSRLIASVSMCPVPHTRQSVGEAETSASVGRRPTGGDFDQRLVATCNGSEERYSRQKTILMNTCNWCRLHHEGEVLSIGRYSENSSGDGGPEWWRIPNPTLSPQTAAVPPWNLGNQRTVQ